SWGWDRGGGKKVSRAGAVTAAPAAAASAVAPSTTATRWIRNDDSDMVLLLQSDGLGDWCCFSVDVPPARRGGVAATAGHGPTGDRRAAVWRTAVWPFRPTKNPATLPRPGYEQENRPAGFSSPHPGGFGNALVGQVSWLPAFYL